MQQLESWLELYFGQKAPRLPDGVREFLVKVAPWLTLIGIIFSLPAILALFGFSALFGPWFMGLGASDYAWNGFYLTLVFSLVVIVLEIIALPGLFHRTRKGWLFAFYVVLVGGLQNVLTMNLGGLIIGLLIGFYILFQVRSHYH